MIPIADNFASKLIVGLHLNKGKDWSASPTVPLSVFTPLPPHLTIRRLDVPGKTRPIHQRGDFSIRCRNVECRLRKRGRSLASSAAMFT